MTHWTRLAIHSPGVQAQGDQPKIRGDQQPLCYKPHTLNSHLNPIHHPFQVLNLIGTFKGGGPWLRRRPRFELLPQGIVP